MSDQTLCPEVLVIQDTCLFEHDFTRADTQLDVCNGRTLILYVFVVFFMWLGHLCATDRTTHDACSDGSR